MSMSINKQIKDRIGMMILRMREKHNSPEVQQLLSEFFTYGEKDLFICLPKTNDIDNINHYKPSHNINLYMSKDDLTLTKGLSLYHNYKTTSMTNYLTRRILNLKENLLSIEVIYNFIMNDLEEYIKRHTSYAIRRKEFTEKNSEDILQRLSKYDANGRL